MKKNNLSIFCLLFATAIISCNDSGTSGSANDTSTVVGNTANNTSNSTAPDTMNAAPAPTTTAMPFNQSDSAFAVKAAEGGLMEVESSNVALQNSTNDRIKAFATMMVNDHSKANSELQSLAGSRGLTLPSALPADKQKHIDAMRKMQGKAFDKHYIDMMMNDHKKTITDFEKKASDGSDADLKAWATKTLPTLKMHRDSVVALRKAKM